MKCPKCGGELVENIYWRAINQNAKYFCPKHCIHIRKDGSIIKGLY